jgi:hypothetical protein
LAWILASQDANLAECVHLVSDRRTTWRVVGRRPRLVLKILLAHPFMGGDRKADLGVELAAQ